MSLSRYLALLARKLKECRKFMSPTEEPCAEIARNR
jgi:hypothetical protein